MRSCDGEDDILFKYFYPSFSPLPAPFLKKIFLPPFMDGNVEENFPEKFILQLKKTNFFASFKI